MLKRFRKTIQDATSSPGRSNSPGQAHQNDAPSASKQDEAYGFLCPVCMSGFNSPDLLQVHFAEAHAENTNQSSAPEPDFESPQELVAKHRQEEKREDGEPMESKSDIEPLHAVASKSSINSPNKSTFDSTDGEVQKVSENPSENRSTAGYEGMEGDALRQEISDMEASLKEEKWYSKELKTELEKKESENRAQRDELEVVRGQMTIAIQTNENLAREKETVLNKLASKSQECATLQSQIDEFKSEKIQLLESAKNQSVELEKAAVWIRDLEAQLNERPAADDFVVLKKELVSVQMLMDQLTQDSEKQKEEAEGRCRVLTEKNTHLKKDIEDLKQAHDEALSKQKSSEAVLVESLQKKESETTKLQEVRSAEIEKVRAELENVQSSLENEQSHGRNLELKNNDLQEKLICEKQEKENIRKELRSVSEEVSSLKKEIEIQKVELSNKEQSREKTQNKLDDLMQQIGKTSSESSSTIRERDLKIESLTQEYEDATVELSAARATVQSLSSNETALKYDLESLSEAHRQLELSKSLEEQKLTQQIEDLKSKLAQASSSDSELQKRIEELEEEARKAWNESQEEKGKSRIATLEAENQISSLKGRNDSLDTELQQYKTLLHEEEGKRSDLETSISKMQGQMKNLEDENAALVGKKENLEKALEDTNAKCEVLSKEKEVVLVDVKRLQQERNDLTEKMEVGEGQAILVGQLKDENQSLLKRLEESDAKSKDQLQQHEAAVKELHSLISDNKTTIKQLQEELTASNLSAKNLDSELEDVKSENLLQKEKLTCKDEELKKFQDELSSQKLDFESRSSLLQRSLDEKTRDYEKMSSTFEGFKVSSESSLKTMEQSRTDLQERFTSVKEENTRMEMELKARDEKLLSKNAEIESLNSATESLMEQHKKEMETTKTRHHEKKSALEAQLASASQHQATLKQELEAANTKMGDVEAAMLEHVKKIKILELDLKDKDNSMSNIKSQAESASAEIVQLKEELQKSRKDHSQQVTELNEKQSQALKVMQGGHQKVCDGLRKEVEKLTAKHVEEERKMKAEIDEKDSFLKLKLSEIEERDSEIKAKIEELENLRNSSECEKAEMAQKISESSDKTTGLEATIKNLRSEGSNVQKLLQDNMTKLRDLESKLAAKENDFLLKEQNLLATSAELALKTENLKNVTENLDETSARLLEKDDQLQQSEGKNTEIANVNKTLEEALNSSKVAKEEVSKKLEEAETKLKNAGVAMDAKEEEMKALKEYFSSKEKEMMAKSEDLASEVEKCMSEILAKSNELEKEKELRNQDQEAWKEQREKMEAEAERKESQFKAEKEELVQSQEMLKGAQQILINSKMELQKHLDAATEEIRSEKEKLSEAEKFHQEKQAAAESRVTALTEELETTKQNLKSTEDEKQNIQARLQLEVSTLRDNLDSVRGEWQQALQQVEEKSTESDDLRGQVVVLQATAQNNADERRALLERCIVAEQSVEQLKQNEAQLKRRLDDAQAAMHELGRENQAMQVKHTTVLSRQWADDREAVECTSCRKPFSMTVRKHHCRHCGKIFCAECSSKTMTVASSKKPVRVCEKCFDDLITVQ